MASVPVILLTSSHGKPNPGHRPGCPVIQATNKAGLSVNFDVVYESGGTTEKALELLKENSSFRQNFADARLVMVFLGGNDLTPDNKPSDDLELPQKVAEWLLEIYSILTGPGVRARRVVVCTLIPRPKFDQFHNYMIEQTNEQIRQEFGRLQKGADTFRIHDSFSFYMKTAQQQRKVFYDGIHLTEKGDSVWTRWLTTKALEILYGRTWFCHVIIQRSFKSAPTIPKR